ncbi:MAG: hypothetical protein AXA67_03490 [Methylothermaceae bacteria B42]|nr:MAG: hypothetical protein AXA67_03490 [Methylothermaceae bacteria B42]HHJ38166.1 hypothetical protein [Methylothermaceae bacterium]
MTRAKTNILVWSFLLLAGCATTEKSAQPKHWQPSTLSSQTIQSARQASNDYFSCIEHELIRYQYRGGDSRYETGKLLKRCENRLAPIRTAFAKENVDDTITQRYLRRKRTQAARHVLRIIMSMEARQRAANQP